MTCSRSCSVDGPAVLARRPPCPRARVGGARAHAGHAVDRDQAVRAVAGAAVQAAAPVVLQRARERPDAGAVQRRGHRVALDERRPRVPRTGSTPRQRDPRSCGCRASASASVRQPSAWNQRSSCGPAAFSGRYTRAKSVVGSGASIARTSPPNVNSVEGRGPQCGHGILSVTAGRDFQRSRVTTCDRGTHARASRRTAPSVTPFSARGSGVCHDPGIVAWRDVTAGVDRDVPPSLPRTPLATLRCPLQPRSKEPQREGSVPGRRDRWRHRGVQRPVPPHAPRHDGRGVDRARGAHRGLDLARGGRLPRDEQRHPDRRVAEVHDRPLPAGRGGERAERRAAHERRHGARRARPSDGSG